MVVPPSDFATLVLEVVVMDGILGGALRHLLSSVLARVLQRTSPLELPAPVRAAARQSEWPPSAGHD